MSAWNSMQLMTHALLVLDTAHYLCALTAMWLHALEDQHPECNGLYKSQGRRFLGETRNRTILLLDNNLYVKCSDHERLHQLQNNISHQSLLDQSSA